jgi:hypothetical protein
LVKNGSAWRELQMWVPWWRVNPNGTCQREVERERERERERESEAVGGASKRERIVTC